MQTDASGSDDSATKGAVSRGATAVVAALVIAAVGWIYRVAVHGYFFNDDFQWLQMAMRFDVAHLFRVEQYSHFYRPVVEAYFTIGYRLFGCDPYPFHLASVAIHLLTGLVVFLFARAFARRADFALICAVIFLVQPSYVDAVAWVGAITDQLPALWYVLTLFLHLRYLQTGRRVFVVTALAAFVVCLMTAEMSATLLAAMLLLEWAVGGEAGRPSTWRRMLRKTPVYLPFVVVLAAYLALAFSVNSRSYLVTEGHYRLGWHAVPNMLWYVVWLYVGKQGMVSYLTIGALAVLLLARGTPRVRFAVCWLALTLLPPSLFTWGNVGRYLYLPAVPFTLLLCEGLVGAGNLLEKRVSCRVARLVVTAACLLVAVRFAFFAQNAGGNFRARTRPYERLAVVLEASNPNPSPGDRVAVPQAAVEGIEEMYRDPAAQVVFCTPDVHVDVR